MADVFLHLEVDIKGIKAKVIEHGSSQTVIKDECIVIYENLTVNEDNQALFDAGMDLVEQQVDISLCSTAMVFVSTGFVSFRTIQLPFGSEKKIRQVLGFELETLLPNADESYISDFHVVDAVDGGHRILSASIARPLVDQYFSTLKRFEIYPLIITPTGYAAAVSFLNAQKDAQNFVFLHAAQSQVTLVVVKNYIPCAVRFLTGDQIIPEDLAKTVKQTLTGYFQRTGGIENFEVFISTDVKTLETQTIYNALETALGYRPRLGEQQGEIDAEAFICSLSPEKSSKYLFNFCKGEYGTLSFFKKYLVNISAGIALLIVALSLMLTSVGMDNSRLEEQVAVVDQKANQIFKTAFPNIKRIQDPYMEMQANVKAAIKKAGGDKGADSLSQASNVKVVRLIGELSHRIDGAIDMEISRFLFSSDRLVLSGSTDNFNNVDKIKGKFESSDLFKKVTISSAASDKKDNKVNFKFIIEL